MQSYWYVSENKLRAMGALDPGPFARLTGKANVGLGPASVEVGIDGAPTRTLTKAIRRAEKQLHGESQIADIADFVSGPLPAVYFESRGPSSRAVIDDMFWVAAIDGNVAVLLVGSVANAVGAYSTGAGGAGRRRPASADPIGAARSARNYLVELSPVMTSDQVFSPSADPIGAARHLFGLSPASAEPDQPAEPGPSAQPTDAQEGVLAYAWTALMNRSLELTGDDVEGLPRSYAISKYEARLKRSSLGRQWQARMTSLVLGTPIYVAQVT